MMSNSLKTKDILDRIAPCGLSCEACCAYGGGPIQQSAKALKEQLGDSFAGYASRFAGMNPVFEHYQAFEKMLDFFAEGSCSGCREQGCLFQSCRVPACVKHHKVDFCFQCEAFPCSDHGFAEGLAKRWLAQNERMKSCGIEKYYNDIKDKPRYP